MPAGILERREDILPEALCHRILVYINDTSMLAPKGRRWSQPSKWPTDRITMLWITIAFLTALAVASQDAWVKRYFAHHSPHSMLAYPMLYSLPLFAVVMILIPVPALGTGFAGYFLAGLPLNGIALFLHMKAIKAAPLSLTLPYLAFTPAFMIFTGMLMLNEVPNLWGMGGIIITCAGSYVLNLNVGQRHWMAPISAIFAVKGSRMMLMVAFLYSFAAVIGKKAITLSNPVFFTVAFFTTLNMGVLITLQLWGKIRLSNLLRSPGHGMVAGGLLFLHALLHCWAISLTKAAYMISVKRLSVIFGIIYGKLIFQEQHFGVRLTGSLLMITGAALIMIKGR